MSRRIPLVLGSIALLSALAPAPQAPADRLAELCESKAKVARQVADFYADLRLAPPGEKPPELILGADAVETWTRKAVDSQLDATADKDRRVAILAQDLERTRAVEARIKDLVEGEAGPGKVEMLKAQYHRLDAEYRLEREKAGR